MLNHSILGQLTPRPERNRFYNQNLPAEFQRLKTARKIAKASQLLRPFQFRSNVAKIRRIAYSLQTLEGAGLINVAPGRIYYKSGEVDIFDVIANTLIAKRDVKPDLPLTAAEPNGQADETAQEIKTACRKFFLRTENLPPKKEEATADRKRYWLRAGYFRRPRLFLAARDIVAGRNFVEQTLKHFDFRPADFLPPALTSEKNRLLCADFERRLDHVLGRAKRLTIKELDKIYDHRFRSTKATLDGLPAGEEIGAAEELKKLPRGILLLMTERGIGLDSRPEEIAGNEDEVAASLKNLKNMVLMDPMILGLREEYRITLVISDLHLQDFRHIDTYDFLRFAMAAFWLGARVVFNGDTYDLWRAGSTGKIRRANRRVCNAINDLKDRLQIRGNHDRSLVHFKENYFDPETNVFIEHGDINDPANRAGANLGRRITRYIVNPLEKLFGPRVQRSLELLLTLGGNIYRILFTPLFSLLGLESRLLLHEEIVQNIVSRIEEKMDERESADNQFSENNPFTYVMGHIHAPGVAYFYEKIMAAIEQNAALKGKVRFILTSSWIDNEAGAGGVLCLARSKKDPAAPTIILPFIWEYLSALELVSGYK